MHGNIDALREHWLKRPWAIPKEKLQELKEEVKEHFEGDNLEEMISPLSGLPVSPAVAKVVGATLYNDGFADPYSGARLSYVGTCVKGGLRFWAPYIDVITSELIANTQLAKSSLNDE